MTECSSSVSSAPESECNLKDESEQRKRKYNESQHDISSRIDDLFHFHPLDHFPDDIYTPTRILQPVMFDVNNSGNINSNGLFHKNMRADMGMMKESDDRDFMGEVINLIDYPIGEQFCVSDSTGFFSMERNTKKNPNLEVSRTSIMSDSDTYSNSAPPFKCQKRSFSDDATVQKGTSHSGGTPLSQAIHEPQIGSPWTIEFLNRVREKSKLRQQSLPHDLSAPSFGLVNNISKFAAKRKSPSLLDFFKYQGGSMPKKIIDRRKLKCSGQPSSSSKNDKNSLSILPTSTPNDKRARRVCLLLVL
jgi:hypothetical protein